MTTHLSHGAPRRALLAGATGLSAAVLVGVAGLALLALLAGCASGSGAGSGSGSGSGDGSGSVDPVAPSGTPTPLPDDGAPTLVPVTVEPVPGEAARTATWRFVEAVTDSGGEAVVVEVEVGGPPCDVVTGVEVDEEADQVVLTLTAGPEQDAAESGECEGAVPAVLGTVHVRVALAAPLGARALVAG